jgi:hypothetical protein
MVPIMRTSDSLDNVSLAQFHAPEKATVAVVTDSVAMVPASVADELAITAYQQTFRA